MDDDVVGRRDLANAAEVHAARRTIDDAIAELAARPLDERAADKMRAVLDAPGLRQARHALRRLASSSTSGVARPPRLCVVAPAVELDESESEDPERERGGAA